MKTIEDLLTIKADLDRCTEGCSFDSPEDEMEHILSIAIRDLDSLWSEFDQPTALETWLHGCLQEHRIRLGLAG